MYCFIASWYKQFLRQFDITVSSRIIFKGGGKGYPGFRDRAKNLPGSGNLKKITSGIREFIKFPEIRDPGFRDMGISSSGNPGSGYKYFRESGIRTPTPHRDAHEQHLNFE